MAARRILTLAVSVVFGVALLPGVDSRAVASPRSDPTSGRAVFTGATAEHASSVTLSPAAMGLAVTHELYFALTSTLAQTSIRGAGTDISDTTVSPGGVIAYLWRTSERLRIGFEARLPPSEDHLEGYDELGYHTLGIGERRYTATVGVGVRITSRIYFGASLTHENTFLKLRYQRDSALANGRGPNGIDSDCDGVPCGIGNPAASELWSIDVRSPYIAANNFKVNIGFLVRVASDVWIGLAYHTPPGGDIQTTLDGDVAVTRAPRDGGGVVGGAANVSISYPASIDGEVRARLPADLVARIGGRWEDLSRFQSYDVRGTGGKLVLAGLPEWTERARGLHDSFAMWGGIEQIDTGEIARFGGRLGFETSAHDVDKTSPMQVSPFSLTLDAGMQLRAQKGAAWLLQLSYGLAYFPTTTVTDSAYDPQHRVDCIESGFDYSTPACAATRAGYALPSANGEYGKLEHALRLGFRYDY
jgi:hypothetical protein